jgi:hypothetical protein
MKAGLLELVDVFRREQGRHRARRAQRTRASSRRECGCAEREAKSWEHAPSRSISARDGTARRADRALGGPSRPRARDRARCARAARAARERFVIDALTRRYGSFGVAAIGGADAV